MSALQLCQKLPPSVIIVFWILYSLWEYGLGKTKWGSTVGLFIETPINKVFSYFGIKLGP